MNPISVKSIPSKIERHSCVQTVTSMELTMGLIIELTLYELIFLMDLTIRLTKPIFSGF